MRGRVSLFAAILGCSPQDDASVGEPRVPDTPQPQARAVLTEVEVRVPPVPAREWPRVELVASSELDDALVAVESSVVPEAELGALFATLARDSAPLCRHQHEDVPVTDKEIVRFIAPPGAYRGALPRTRRSMISGCWNFVHMNDRRPDRDIELVAALYEAPSYDCTAVGVMQPYLMQHILGCAQLTMLDFDWQIHRVHAQLLAAMREGRLGEDPNPALTTMRVDWIAYHNAREQQHLSLAMLCDPEMHAACREALLSSQDTLPSVEGITLALAGLHEAPFGPAPPGRQRVIYLSNALERAYTSRDEFHAMMDRLAASLAADEVAVLIHHAGGNLGFGLYEVRSEGGAWRVHTRCRDPYVTSVTRPDATYETWLEGVTRDPGPVPTCAQLIDEQQGQYPIPGHASSGQAARSQLTE